MIAVILEVFPIDGKMDEYLDIASRLRMELSKMEGFISIERFQSLSNPGKMLSLSYWVNEESLSSWRNAEVHRHAQSTSRESLFEHYQLRVAVVMRDYGMTDRHQAPEDSNSVHISSGQMQDI